MFIRRVCAAAIIGLAMSAGMVGTSLADSNDWYPKGAYGSDAYHGKKFNRNYISCDRDRDVCYDRFGISYYATARYLGEREANRSVKKYGKQVFLFSPKRGVICDRRTDSCTSRRVANDNYGSWNNGNWNNQSTQSRDGFGAIGSSNDWRKQQQVPYWKQYED